MNFLQHIAHDLVQRYGHNLSHLTVVLPSKRSALFLNDYLVREAQGPVWAPNSITINQLFATLSPYQPLDDVTAVCLLYDVYSQHLGSRSLAPTDQESLDRFYTWGEVMLSDFDDIDKNMVDAKALFRHIADIKEIERENTLTTEQEAALQHFFADFSIEGNTRLKEYFLHMWEHMGAIYQDYNHLLKSRGELYEGALFRDVIDRLDPSLLSALTSETYVFIGFNVLNKVESRLMQWLQHEGRALFYWDYDTYYCPIAVESTPFEAGHFLRQNLQQFPNALPPTCFQNFDRPKTVDLIAASTENASVHHLPQWISAHLPQLDEERQAAVILCNEQQLQPVLHVLPGSDALHHVNVTMGFALSDTPVFSFIQALMALQTTGLRKQVPDDEAQTLRGYHHHEVAALQHHPYYQTLYKDDETDLFQRPADNLSFIAYLQQHLGRLAVYYRQQRPVSEDHQTTPSPAQCDPLIELYHESAFRIHQLLNRFQCLIEEGILKVERLTLKRLIMNVLTSTKIPFHGEPAIGLQVMGLLETRNLDFRHLVMLSVSEGNLPKSTAHQTSFIPYYLRDSFGLTTIERKVAVFAYYFYRLLQRAEHITILYNASPGKTGGGELSRFVKQLQVQCPPHMQFHSYRLSCPPGSSDTPQAQPIHKTPAMLQHLLQRFSGQGYLSPSALNTYIDCPLSFYYKYVLGLRTPDTLTDDIDAPTFGTLFHDAAEILYNTLSQRNPLITAPLLDQVLKDADKKVPGNIIDHALDQSFRRNYFKVGPHHTVHHTGQSLLVREVIHIYLKRLLQSDKKTTPFHIVALEHPFHLPIQFQTPDGPQHIQIGGKIDRIDSLMVTNGDQFAGTDQAGIPTLRVLDYKTGGEPATKGPDSAEELFQPSDKRNKYLLQTLFYAEAMHREMHQGHRPQQPIAPALYFVNRSVDSDVAPLQQYKNTPINNYAIQCHDDLVQELTKAISQIFDPTLPFHPATDIKSCKYCDFKALCGRKSSEY